MFSKKSKESIRLIRFLQQHSIATILKNSITNKNQIIRHINKHFYGRGFGTRKFSN